MVGALSVYSMKRRNRSAPTAWGCACKAVFPMVCKLVFIVCATVTLLAFNQLIKGDKEENFQ